MKNRIILMAAAIAAMMVSCQKVEISTPVVKTEPMVISAGVETKTSLGTDGKTVNWTSDDVIAVFDNQNGRNDFSATSVNGASATFAGSVTKGTTQFYAVYPSNLASVSDGVLSVTIPTTQTPAVGTFAEEHNISVASGSKTPGTASVGNVTFQNICGLLKFSLPKSLTNITSVSISSETPIAGTGTVTFSTNEAGEIVATFNGGSESSIIMTPGEGEVFTFKEDNQNFNTFWFVVAPVNIQTLTVSVATQNNGTYEMTKNWGTNGYPLEAGKYINLGTLEMRQVVAAANHVYDTNGVLTGTELTITLPEVDKNKKIVSTNFVVKKEDGAAVTGWDAINAPGLTYAKPSSYPYLPQGKYKISGTYTTDKGVTYSISESEFVVGAPFSSGDQLGVTHKVYTSYTYYSEGDVSTANDCKPLVIYNKSVVANISSSILNNSAYNNIKSLKTNSTEGDLTVSTYGEHTVSSTFTFEGVTSKKDDLKCHITGLPYTMNPASNDGWSLVDNNGNQQWNKTIDYDLNFDGWTPELKESKVVRLGYVTNEKSSTIQKSFNVPAGKNINISVSSTGIINSQYQYVNLITYTSPANTISVLLGDTLLTSETLDSGSPGFTLNLKDIFYNNKSYSINVESQSNISGSQMTQTNNRISLSNSYNGKKGRLNVSYYSFTDITSFKVLYK